MSNQQFDLSQFSNKFRKPDLSSIKWFTIIGIAASALLTSFCSIPAAENVPVSEAGIEKAEANFQVRGDHADWRPLATGRIG